MRRLILIGLAFLLIVGVVSVSVPAAPPINSVGTISLKGTWFGQTYEEEGCSIWAVRPNLLVTAAHCVDEWILRSKKTGKKRANGEDEETFWWEVKNVGETRTVTYYRGVAKIQMKAVVVWSSFLSDRDPGLDVAFLVSEKPWPATLKLASAIPKKGDRAELLSFALGIRRWAGYGVFDGLFEQSDLGWMLIYRSDYGAGGASGSPVFVDGKVVGMHSHGYAPLKMSLAMPVGRIRMALLDLEVFGPMQDRVLYQAPEYRR